MIQRKRAHVRHRLRPARVLSWLLIIVVVLAGSVGGFVLARLTQTTAEPAHAEPEVDNNSGQLWTCGMHPQVIEREPGECPICHMKLTPLKAAEEDTHGDQAGAPREREILYWRAPMDPSYVSDRPGKSPMGMELVPVYADETESPTGQTVTIDPVTIQNMGLRTTVVHRGPLVRMIRTLGRVDYNERTVHFIDTKFDGWIERLHVDQTGVLVEQGEPLFDVYSPRLYAAQEEYLAALRGVERLSERSLPEAAEQAERLVEAAGAQLEYFDVSEEQIERLRRTRQIQKALTIHAPATGIVTEKMALAGMYVKPGMRLYTIADLSRVWVFVDIYEYQLPWVRIGQAARMTLPYTPGREYTGRVVYIYPYLEKQTRVIKVRLEFENADLELKPDMYANVTLEADLDRHALLIPREAYIDSGTRKLVFVDLTNGKFQPREIQAGAETEDGQVEVLYGLDEGDVVVTSGQFLLDGESKLKEAVAKMLAARRAPVLAQTPLTAPPEHVHAVPAGIPPDARYACPMETHPAETDPARQGAFFSADPGRCDWCGMELEPLEELEWARARMTAGEADVAHTCPDHPHVYAETSGNCPRCGQPLKPFRVMYTCPDPQHAAFVSTTPGTCPDDGRALVPFRGVWLAPEMAADNLPPNPEVADAAPYRCPTHPLVHSDRPGHCTICGQPLKEAKAGVAEEPEHAIPPNARFVCPMKECWHFAETDDEDCPECGMRLRPIEEVEWAREAVAKATAPADAAPYVCPMHPEQVKSDEQGNCPICGMRLVRLDALPRPASAPAAIAVQMNFLMEHYLELHKRFAADRTTEVPLHALGLAAAADKLTQHLDQPGVDLPAGFKEAVGRLRSAALQTTGRSLEADRVTFVELSAAMRTLVAHVRPDRKQFPQIYVFHCPMSKGDWLQDASEIANPYYGFKMLDCGELQEKK